MSLLLLDAMLMKNLVLRSINADSDARNLQCTHPAACTQLSTPFFSALARAPHFQILPSRCWNWAWSAGRTRPTRPAKPRKGFILYMRESHRASSTRLALRPATKAIELLQVSSKHACAQRNSTHSCLKMRYRESSNLAREPLSSAFSMSRSKS
jgi:hypothetical protein